MGKQKNKDPFIENETYHVFNRTNNKELLFINNQDHLNFLDRFNSYSHPFMGTYSWNLLPNHFHLLVKINSYESIISHLKNQDNGDLCLTEKRFIKGKANIHDLIDNVFKRFFISYTMNFNNSHERKGNLLHRPFKHVHVIKESQFTQNVIYINANAQKHKLVKDFAKYKWSSYNTIISNKPTKLLRTELLTWFGGKAQFIKTLKAQSDFYNACEYTIEDD